MMTAASDREQFETLLQHFDRPKWVKPETCRVRCPGPHHQRGDLHPSLELTLSNDGHVLVKCWSGECTMQEVAAGANVPVSAFFPADSQTRNGRVLSRSTTTANGGRRQRLTLAALAAAKKLPEAFVRAHGVSDTPDGVRFRYLQPDGITEARPQIRTALSHDGLWVKWGSPVTLPIGVFGRDLLADARAEGLALVVEGPTDVLAARFHGIAALGIPGAHMYGKLQREDVEGIGKLAVVEEPGPAGVDFVTGVSSRLRELDHSGTVVRVNPSPWKDIAEAHEHLSGDEFSEWIVAALEKAAVIDLEQAPGAASSCGAAESEPLLQQAQQVHAVVRTLSDVTPEEVSWHWPRRIARGKLTQLIGDPGVGKPYMMLAVAAKISRGGMLPDGAPVEAGDAILLSAEDGVADTIRARAERQGADLRRIHVIEAIRDGEGERGFLLERDIAVLEQTITEKHAVLVVIDPISGYFGTARDSYKDAEVRAVLAPLVAMAGRTGVAVVAIAHLTKDEKRAAIHRALASVAFVAAARIVLAVAYDPDDSEEDLGRRRRLLLPVKNNLAPPADALAFRIGTEGLEWVAGTFNVTADAVFGRMGETGEERGAREEAVEFLRARLADGPVPTNVMRREARAAGISDRTLDRARAVLGVRAVREGEMGRQGGGIWGWRLPDEGLTTPSGRLSAPFPLGSQNLAHLTQERENSDDLSQGSIKYATPPTPRGVGVLNLPVGAIDEAPPAEAEPAPAHAIDGEGGRVEPDHEVLDF